MKSIILTIGFVLTSMVAMSQYTTIKSNTEIPVEEWYELEGEQFEGVMYITSTDVWITYKLKSMLKANGLSFSKPTLIQKENGKTIYKAWEYVDEDGRLVLLSYLFNSEYSSDLSIQYKED